MDTDTQDGTTLDRKDYPCENCGALLAYKPGMEVLACDYCGHENPIEITQIEVVENDLDSALRDLENSHAVEHVAAVKCDSCAAEFTLAKNETAGRCPFCAVPVVVDPVQVRRLSPDALLPFKLTAKEARTATKRWLKRSWLAPEAMRRHTTADDQFKGVYLPHWTFDADTATRYQGFRGDTYTVTVGSGENRRTETRVRWTPKSGRVTRLFDDVLVPSSNSLPRQHLSRLTPWDLENQRPYADEYLAGYISEAYQVPLTDGFVEAKQIMQTAIERDVRRSIGGDRQRITRLDTRYDDTTFKHVLLPTYLSAFRWNDRVYRFVVNARTGEVQGERPTSVWKVAVLVVLGLLLAGLVLYLLAISEG
ncbi:MAG: primosomal protein N' (replication factor Y) - superfamily II helicase [Alphaproteobacteria bacterium TMED89]|nr:primosomal protein N' (replication factor Y) - superfamily II helicase [Rhodospirillaceae bacterium]RPH13545.1 MAG: primosomal protein N' (replication factor Y) - superfamily II helicase [Alphaproteobacteria bacterium TMED89]